MITAPTSPYMKPEAGVRRAKTMADFKTAEAHYTATGSTPADAVALAKRAVLFAKRRGRALTPETLDWIKAGGAL